jgi:hypothetical protein
MAPERQTAGQSAGPVHQGWPDTSRLRALGWKPRTDIAEGFRRTVLSVEAGPA